MVNKSPQQKVTCTNTSQWSLRNFLILHNCQLLNKFTGRLHHNFGIVRSSLCHNLLHSIQAFLKTNCLDIRTLQGIILTNPKALTSFCKVRLSDPLLCNPAHYSHNHKCKILCRVPHIVPSSQGLMQRELTIHHQVHRGQISLVQANLGDPGVDLRWVSSAVEAKWQKFHLNLSSYIGLEDFKGTQRNFQQ